MQFERGTKINDLNYKQIINLMNVYILKQLNDKKLNKLNTKLPIYFEKQRINGTKLFNMRAKEFAKSMIKYFKNDKTPFKNQQRNYTKPYNI